MPTTIRATSAGEFKPDELPDMVENAVMSVTLNLAAVAGTNTITPATVTCDTLTIGTPSIAGKNITFTVTASNLGTHQILASATLSNGEIVKGYIRACVKGEPCTDARDYE
jgi:hypothetical protein